MICRSSGILDPIADYWQFVFNHLRWNSVDFKTKCRYPRDMFKTEKKTKFLVFRPRELLGAPRIMSYRLVRLADEGNVLRGVS